MTIFIASILSLMAMLWALGWYAKRWVHTDSDYLLAGRQVSLIPGIASICGIAFAGSMTGIIPSAWSSTGSTSSAMWSGSGIWERTFTLSEKGHALMLGTEPDGMQRTVL